MQNKKVLFVCLGNICRSSAAEAVLKKYLEKEGLQDKVFVDSAGTAGYHIGEPSDPRMIKAASKRGYNIDHIGRKFRAAKDFLKFDYIITMDNQNFADIKELDHVNKFSHKIFKMSEFCKDIKFEEVPDPYYENEEGFEKVLNILEDGCRGILERLKSNAEG